MINMVSLMEKFARKERGEYPRCGKVIDVSSFRDALSRKEFSISGFCQECQDVIFND